MRKKAYFVSLSLIAIILPGIGLSQEYAGKIIDIKVGDKEMSVSAAIVYRDQIIPMYKDLLTFLRIKLQNALTQSEANDQTAKDRAEQWLQNELQSDAKTDSDRIDRMRQDYLANKIAKVHDPLKLEEWIKQLSAQIELEEGDLQTGLYNNNVSTELTWSPTE